jgi:hypothetical protein
LVYRKDDQWWKETNVKLGVRERERERASEKMEERKRVSKKLETSWNNF